MNSLTAKHCIPCEEGVSPLKGAKLHALQNELDVRWNVVDEHHLQKDFIFPDFAEALKFTIRIGTIAEQENHHPDICLSWGKVRVQIFTHKIDGLSESDFILAAKLDEL